MRTAPYCSYLLRLWLEPNSPPEWRAILESAVSSKRHGFASMEDLFAFLTKETERLENEKNAPIPNNNPGA